MRAGGIRQSRKKLARIAQHRTAARMPVLNVKDRIVARLLDHLDQIEVEHGVVAPVEHHEANGVAADLVYHFAQGDELAGPL
jgi:hypothetical protein